MAILDRDERLRYGRPDRPRSWNRRRIDARLPLRRHGGETAFGGPEAVVIMVLDPEGPRFRYILLATNRTGTMQREMNETPLEYNFAGMTVFSSTFGGREAAVIFEAEIAND